jgi:hypothetical protein
MKPNHVLLAGLLALHGAGTVTTGVAQNPPPGQVWTYSLIEGSTFIKDCPVCDHVTVPLRVRGTFNLVLTAENLLFTQYEVGDIALATVPGAPTPYSVQGTGTYQFGGEVALQQTMGLELHINDGSTNELVYFTNAVAQAERVLPMIDIEVDEVTKSQARVYRLHLVAMPFREIWFSTAGGMTPGNPQLPVNHLSPGDLLSHTGRVVKSQAEFLNNLELMPSPSGDLGVDALDIRPGGESLFSLNANLTSTNLGPIQHGDLLSDRGRIVRTNQDLMANFGLMPPAMDVGLDAVHVMPDGEILFSINTDVFSELLGTNLFHGDILSDKGYVFRTNQKLLSRFHPDKVDHDYGLDALYLWPSGELWFSTEEGFTDGQLGPVLAGDLLSDQGYRVFGNLELVSAFQPLEGLADFGLDAVFVVTDATPPAPAPPVLRGIKVDSATGASTINWEGQGRVFQLEGAYQVTGPYSPVEPISPTLLFTDPAGQGLKSASFYRLRQW